MFVAVSAAECNFGEGESGAVGVFGGGHAIEQFDGANEIHGILNESRAGHLLPEFLSAGSAASVQARLVMSSFQTLLFIAEFPVGTLGRRNADRVAGDCRCKCRASRRIAACGLQLCWRSVNDSCRFRSVVQVVF